METLVPVVRKDQHDVMEACPYAVGSVGNVAVEDANFDAHLEDVAFEEPANVLKQWRLVYEDLG